MKRCADCLAHYWSSDSTAVFTDKPNAPDSEQGYGLLKFQKKTRRNAVVSIEASNSEAAISRFVLYCVGS